MMLVRVSLAVLSPIVFSLCAHLTAAAQECHPAGPIVPKPDLTRSAGFQAAAQRLADILDSAVNGTVRAGWDVPNVSFSVAVVARDQERGETPLWEYHHRGSNNSDRGTAIVDRHSQYMIGSVSKVLTMAVALRAGMDMDAPITQYLPELGEEPSLIAWKNITLRALASHMSGMPPNLGLSEWYYLKNYSSVLGFPDLTDGDYPPCDVAGLNDGCTEPQIFEGLKKALPVAPPMERPVYSNQAFNLIMLALGRQTGKSYAALLEEYVTRPFGMRSTYPSPGNDSQGVVPPMDSSWGTEYLFNAPTGGLVSTISDLSIFLHSLLTYSALDSRVAVREWLQPRSYMGSPYSAFGMPWEIFRPPPEAVFPEYDATTGGGGHTVTLFKKDGIAIAYRSRIALLDEYGIGFIILTTGDNRAMNIVSNALMRTLVPAVDAAARVQTEDLGYAKTFVNSCGGAPFNVTFALDDRGLTITSLMRNELDVIASLRAVYASTLSLVSPSFQITPGSLLRLSPAQVSRSAAIRNQTVALEDWRFIWDDTLRVESDLPGSELGSLDCRAWESVDLVHFGGEPVDRLVFVKDANTGAVLAVDIPFLRSNGTSNGRCL